MKIPFLKLLGAAVCAAAVAALCVYAASGVAANYAEYHAADTAARVSADEAAYGEFPLDVTAGVTVEFGAVKHDNYLSVTIGADDTLLAEFRKGGKKVGSIVLDGGGWAQWIVGARGDKPVLHLIPVYIAKAGYDTLTFSVLRGDGDYRVSSVSVQALVEPPRAVGVNIIDFEIKQLEIEIGNKNFEKIQEDRDKALRGGLLLVDGVNKVPAKLTVGGKSYQADARLKGTFGDHWAGDQWSMNLDVGAGYAIWGMQHIEIQQVSATPTNDWYAQDWYHALGGVALRYDVTDVFLNGEYKGVFFVQGAAEKREVEHSLHREGPILKLDHTLIVPIRFLYKPKVADYPLVPFFFTERAKTDAPNMLFEAGQVKKTAASRELSDYARYAIDGMNRYWSGQSALGDVFDLDMWAKLFAVYDALKAQHGLEFEDIRYYYNPITGKVEPVPNDAGSVFEDVFFAQKPQVHTVWLTKAFFDDAEFRLLYKKNMLALIEGAADFMQSERATLTRFNKTIARELYQYSYHDGNISANLEAFQTLLDESRLAAPDVRWNGGDTLRVANDDATPIIVTGIVDGGGNRYAESQLPLTLFYAGSEEAVRDIALGVAPEGNLFVEYEHYFVPGLRHAAAQQVVETAEVAETAEPAVENAATDGAFSFYVAGHFYGTPTGEAEHPHPPFVAYAPTIAADDSIKFGVLLGDIAYSATAEEYAKDAALLDSIGKPYHVLAGNHDTMSDDGAQFRNYFPKDADTLGSYFEYGGNLFILLGTVQQNEGEVIDERQMDIARQAMAAYPNCKNIFVFTHELIWLDLDDPRFNWFDTRHSEEAARRIGNDGPLFKNTILPLFQSYGAKLYFIAGNAGGYAEGDQIFYGEYDGVTYIATGLGSKIRDNIVVVDVPTGGGNPTFRLVALNGDDPNALGRLEDYAGYKEGAE